MLNGLQVQERRLVPVPRRRPLVSSPELDHAKPHPTMHTPSELCFSQDCLRVCTFQNASFPKKRTLQQPQSSMALLVFSYPILGATQDRDRPAQRRRPTQHTVSSVCSTGYTRSIRIRWRVIRTVHVSQQRVEAAACHRSGTSALLPVARAL